MKTNFHNKIFALSLAFIIRFKGTQKWPILVPCLTYAHIKSVSTEGLILSDQWDGMQNCFDNGIKIYCQTLSLFHDHPSQVTNHYLGQYKQLCNLPKLSKLATVNVNISKLSRVNTA